MSNEVSITVSGPCGSGKSALLGEIEIMCKALGLSVRYADEKRAQADKNMNHADWTSELEIYNPSVVLVEGMPWLTPPAVTAPDLSFKASYHAEANKMVEIISLLGLDILAVEHDHVLKAIRALQSTAPDMSARDARTKYVFQEILTSLPARRDWLNPDVEREMRELYSALRSQPKGESQ